MSEESPLGQSVAYPERYDPGALHAIARADGRAAIGIDAPLPFAGEDVWNAWDLTWLDATGRPVAATAEMRVPASSPNIIESKSLKLYLGSLAMSRFADLAEVEKRLRHDLSDAAGDDVEIRLQTGDNVDAGIGRLDGDCIDAGRATADGDGVDAGLLQTSAGDVVSESLHSHLLRSLCPVTAQPDLGSVLVSYRGPRIDRDSLLRYIVSYRRHNDFHEACVERMFVDIRSRCRTEQLSVYARYQRRGGIDINPYRSDVGASAPNMRLWRQ